MLKKPKPHKYQLKNFPYLVSAYVSEEMEETLRLVTVAWRSDRSKVVRQALQEFLDRALADPELASRVERMRG